MIEKITLFKQTKKNYICIPIKNSNPEFWVLEKKLFLEKKNRDPWRQAGLTNEMKNLSKQIAQLLQKLCVTLLDICKFVFS